MDYTLLQTLSGFILERLDGVTPSQLLSALASLSSMPNHPYELAKHQLLGPDYKFPIIQEIEAPKDFCLTTAANKLNDFADEINDLIIDSVNSLSCIGLSQDGFSENVVFDKEVVKNHIIFSELVKTVTIDDINANPIEISQKLISFYLKDR